MINVKATREGLLGKPSASGWLVDRHVPAVALPSTHALRRCVHLVNPLNQRSCDAMVLDVGPWHTDDDAYVFEGERPRAEAEPNGNHAGIDLSEFCWHALGMKDNTEVMWEFL